MPFGQVGTNEAGQIEMEEQSVGETLEEKLEDFAEVIPNISGTDQEDNINHDDQETNEESQLEPERETEESKLVNNNSIVTKVTIEAHDITDLDKSIVVSTRLPWSDSWRSFVVE